ncbi:N-acetyltransferase family protein [Mycobacterium sp.]|uniref:GNAT family N-acetyltransferase n=1 Tax=Mycobacterium sp. TaxID=1785 RepID=UPI003C77C02D
MIEVRPAAAEDAMDVARVHVRSWQSAYRGLIDQDYLDGLTPEARASRYTFGRVGLQHPYTLIAVDGSVIRGLASTCLCRDKDLANFGELIAIYVDPDHIGTGVGRLLMAAAREQLRRLGVTSAALWVLEGNVRARRFYERDGWRSDGGRRTETYGNAPVQELRYRRNPV